MVIGDRWIMTAAHNVMANGNPVSSENVRVSGLVEVSTASPSPPWSKTNISILLIFRFSWDLMMLTPFWSLLWLLPQSTFTLNTITPTTWISTMTLPWSKCKTQSRSTHPLCQYVYQQRAQLTSPAPWGKFATVLFHYAVLSILCSFIYLLHLKTKEISQNW